MKKIIIILSALVLTFTSMAADVEVVPINIHTEFTWEDPNTNRTDIVGYHFYVFAPGKTNIDEALIRSFVVGTNVMSTNVIYNLPNGKYVVGVTAVAKYKLESPEVEIATITWNNGHPVAPKKFQLFEVIRAVAKYNLPPPLPEVGNQPR